MSRLVLEVNNKDILDKLLWMLKHFKEDGIKITKIDTLKENQDDIQEYDVDYEKSFQYKLDRADFIQMKESL
jgi:hypothetical protein